MIFTDTVTIYNNYKESGTDCWKRTVINGVQWSDQVAKTVTSDGKLSIAKSVNLTIPYGAPDETYVGPKEWAAMDDKTGHWTLGTKNLDVIVRGEIDTEISGSTTISTLLSTYDDAATIQTVNDNTNRDRLKTWKVVAD